MTKTNKAPKKSQPETQKTKVQKVLTQFGEFRHGLDTYRKTANAAVDLLESPEFTAVIKAGATLFQKTLTAVSCMKEAMKEDPAMSREETVNVCQFCEGVLSNHTYVCITEKENKLHFCSDKCQRAYNKNREEK